VIDKLSTQHRVLIATVLSFAFFVGYDYFFIPKNVPTQTEATTSVTQTSAPQTPASSSSVSQTAPSPSMSSASLDSEYIATVRGEHFELKLTA